MDIGRAHIVVADAMARDRVPPSMIMAVMIVFQDQGADQIDGQADAGDQQSVAILHLGGRMALDRFTATARAVMPRMMALAKAARSPNLPEPN